MLILVWGIIVYDFEESYANGANSSGSMMNYFATAAGVLIILI